MLSTRSSGRLCTSRQATQLSRAAASLLVKQPSSSSYYSLGYPAGLRAAGGISKGPGVVAVAYFSTTPAARLRDFFPPKETPHIRKTPPAWAHHGFTYEEMLAVVPGHREPRNVSDYLAFKLVKLARYSCRVKSWRNERTNLWNPQMVHRHRDGRKA